MKKGIDISTFQGNIDWRKVRQGGTEFAMLRGGYGRFETDEKFESNYKNAVKAGMPVGVYHYSYANTVEKAREEARFCLSYLKGKKFEYPIAFDIEDKSLYSLSKKTLTDITYAFCSEIEKNGYYVCIYSYKAFLESKLDMSRLSRFDIWVAQWGDRCTYNGNYGMWQYSDKGEISGISGRVDLDKSYRDYPKIMKKKGLNGCKKSVAASYKKGDAVTLKNTPVFVSSTAKTPTARLTGKYYIYDGKKINGRYRITNSKSNAGKLPTVNFVTGWIDKK